MNMSADVYAKVLDKLMREIPLLSCIELSPWSDPFLNPEVAEIVKNTEKQVSCRLTTPLQSVKHLEQVIAAQPSQLAVTINGVGETYEAYNEGASWQTLIDNLRTLKEVLSKYSSATLVAILCHKYKDESPDEFMSLRELCSELGFTYIPDWPYLSSYDAILAGCHGDTLDPSDQRLLNNLPWRYEQALQAAKREADKPCLCQRIFPIIQPDCSVALCHLYRTPIVTRDWLSLSWEEVLQLRHTHEHCGDCQSFGLHRLDIDVLLKQYPAHDILYGS
jgi:hypothetical protein